MKARLLDATESRSGITTYPTKEVKTWVGKSICFARAARVFLSWCYGTFDLVHFTAPCFLHYSDGLDTDSTTLQTMEIIGSAWRAAQPFEFMCSVQFTCVQQPSRIALSMSYRLTL